MTERRTLAGGLIGLLIAIGHPHAAEAQAWVPRAGSGALSVSFQTVEHTGHRLTDGTYIDNGRSRTGGLFVEADFGLTRRLSISVGVPFVLAKYIDDDAPPPFLPFRPVDQCRCWHSGWQDVGFTTRWNLIDTFDHVLSVTPSVSVGVPSHAYDYQGEAVIGRRLKEVRFVVDAGRRLDEISRNLSVTGRYSYAVVERVIDIPNNRSNAAIELNWRTRSGFSFQGSVAAQRTHGGLRAGSLPGSALVGPGEINTQDRLDEHDRLLRDNRVHIGAAASVHTAVGEIFASYMYFLAGTDTHAGFAITAGFTRAFTVRR